MRTQFASSEGGIPAPNRVELPEPPLLIDRTTGALITSSSAGGGSGSGTASGIMLANAPAVTFSSWYVSATPSLVPLGTLAGVGASPYYVRKLTLQASEANTQDVFIAPVTVGVGSYRRLTPGQEYVIDAPEGTKFDVNQIQLFSAGGTQNVSVFYFR